ncbi:MAG TPA: phosphoribosylglycinamide formyltransferase [Methanocorpusculum sp.]|nr:phosphoribosylglycinamide formyltransferase [Methanocorpusculum sp.]
MKRILVLASGRGSNFKAILDSISKGAICGTCIALVTDNKQAYAIELAKKAGIKSIVLNYSDYPDKPSYESDLLSEIQNLNPDLIVCAGYMRILGSQIIHAFPYKILNVHPALLPAFKGLNAQRQSLEYGVKIAGCTVHFVDEYLDSGPIIIQRCVSVFDTDTEQDLDDRILHEEHIALPEAVSLFCADRLKISGRYVYIIPKKEE